eukprot:4293633-Amphidinium_carterae.1
MPLLWTLLPLRQSRPLQGHDPTRAMPLPLVRTKARSSFWSLSHEICDNAGLTFRARRSGIPGHCNKGARECLDFVRVPRLPNAGFPLCFLHGSSPPQRALAHLVGVWPEFLRSQSLDLSPPAPIVPPLTAR